MKKETIAAKIPGKDGAEDKTAQIVVDFPETLEEAMKMYPNEAILSNALANYTITLQGNMRSGMKKGETQEQLQGRLGAAKMGTAVRGVKIDPKQSFFAMFASATPEEKAKLLAELKGAAGK